MPERRKIRGRMGDLDLAPAFRLRIGGGVERGILLGLLTGATRPDGRRFPRPESRRWRFLGFPSLRFGCRAAGASRDSLGRAPVANASEILSRVIVPW